MRPRCERTVSTQQGKELVMRLKSFRVFVSMLLFGLLLGAASTAHADTVVITSFSFSNLEFNPATGTSDPLMQQDRKRLDKICCAPQLPIHLQGSPKPVTYSK
jgi:hypothetical protein